jgi:8-oxo-dGTP diphosphatase
MEIESLFTDAKGETVRIQYRDADSVSELDGRKVSGVHAYCFYRDQLVIVFAKKKGFWTPPGGGVEAGETPEEAVIREVREETNMDVLRQSILGYQDISKNDEVVTQVRFVCIVEPLGEFLADPDEDITEIKFINPSEYKQYFDWGEVGDHLMERALKLRSILGQ